MIWKRHLTLDELNATSDNTMVAHLGIVYTRLGDDVLEAEMPVDTRRPAAWRRVGGAGGNAGIDGRIYDDPRRTVCGGHGT